jgi:hypothetical protein
MNTPRLILNWACVQLIIVDTIDKPGGASWRQIKEAVLAEGLEPGDWLTQVRGPLQGLIQEGVIRRVDHDDKGETYELASKEH